MQLVKGLLLAFIIGLFLTCSISYAHQVNYTVGPICKNNKVICKNPNEIPTCLKLEPKVHLELENFVNGEVINRYQPSCDSNPNNLSPKCIDPEDENQAIALNVTLDCVEYIQCKENKETKKLTEVCSGGKLPKCLGDDNEPNCNNNSVCVNNSVPVCEYTWQANLDSSLYH